MGILLAEINGYFGDVGLEVVVRDPVTPDRTFGYVAGGTVDLGLVHQPELVLAGARGAPVAAVASVITQPTTSMIWLPKSKIEGIADLRGKTIAILGLDYEKPLLENLLAREGLTLADVKIETVDEELVPALVGGRADAIFGGSWNVEGAELEARGLEPVITRLQSIGAPSYEELVLMGRRDRLSADPQSIRDFISAMTRGTALALEDPEAAAEAIATRIGRAPGKVLDAELEATVPLLSEDAHMSEEKAGQLVDWMYREGLIERKPPVSALLTNEYVPSP
ncbi:MAG TPA: ABC transporter substrate-binding protein [Solirubrobacterales bacterium]|nr:ABC transporter substrate-binding protein [Solirubrobacterales bacterium]